MFATDPEPQVESLVTGRLSAESLAKLEVSIGQFPEVDLQTADLVCAQCSLPFAEDKLVVSIRSAVGAVAYGGETHRHFLHVRAHR